MPRTPVSNREFFAGRWEQLTAVSDAVFQAGLHIVIFGERGVGKTSLANVIQPLVEVMEEDFTAPKKPESRIVARTNASVDDDFSNMWERVFNEISWTDESPQMGFRPAPNKKITRLMEAMGLQPPLSIDDVRRTLSYLPRSIFVFDEFDRSKQAIRRKFTDLVKALSDHAIDSTVVLVGVSDTIDELVRDHGSIARSVVQVFLPRMSEKELRAILSKATATLGVVIDEDAADFIIRISQGLPHYTHLIGLNATREALESRCSTRITSSDVFSSLDKAVSQAVQTIREKYHTAIRSAHKSALYDKVLLACAAAATKSQDGLGYFHASAVVEPLSMILDRSTVPIAAFQRHINQFAEKARGPILERSGPPRAYKYRFRDPLLPTFVFMTSVSQGVVDQERLNCLMF